MAGALLLLCVISALFVAPSAWRAAGDGRTALVEAARAVQRRDARAAKVEFEAAHALFATAERRLSSPLAWPLWLTPVVRTHARVARSLSMIGTSVATSGVTISDTMDDLPEQSLAFREGRVNLGEVRRAEAALSQAAATTDEIQRAIADMPSGWVMEPLRTPRDQAREELPSILDGVRKAQAALHGLPSILGEGGRKRYLVAFSNLSELRGSGGLFGFVTALEAVDGDLALEDRSGRPTDVFPKPGEVGLHFPDWFPDDFRTQAGIFQNINMTTDFPTVGGFALQTAETRWGPMDGVIAVDPIGISAILGLTGPITVETWPHQITAENVSKIAMHDAYITIPDNDTRERFFQQLVTTAFDKLTTSTIRLSASSAGTFDGAVQGGHFRMYSDHPADERVFEQLGAAGNVDRAATATDVLSVVSENASGSKIDWYLRRDIRYRVALHPDDRSASTSLNVAFRNAAPASGLPRYIIGSALPGLPLGTTRQILLLVRSTDDRGPPLRIGGEPVTTVTESEGALLARRSTVDVRPRGEATLAATSSLRDALIPFGSDLVYRLHVLPQAVATPDFADIEISVPRGWRAVGTTRFVGDLKRDVVLEVRVRRTLGGSLIGEPLGAFRRLLGRVF